MKKNTHGGKRSNAGRKPIEPKKKKTTLTIYPEQQHVDKWGSKSKAQEVALNAVENQEP